MIKAIFFDIDGTLLGFKTHMVSPGTMTAFERLHQKGILTFISTGRPMVLIPPMPISFDGYITVNGGYCISNNNILLDNPIDHDDCRHWLDYVKRKELTTMAFTANEMFINRIDPQTIALRNELGFKMPPISPFEELDKQTVYQFIAMQPESDDAEVLSNLRQCRMPRWHPAFSDIIPINSSKAVGIEHTLRHFGIAPDEAMAFGDGENDIEMLEFVGCGVAMGNASDSVKQKSDYVTDSADDEGIINALLKLNVI